MKVDSMRRQQMKFFHRSLHFPKDLLARRKVAAKLQDINRRMKSITDRAHQFRVHQQLEDWGSKRIMCDLSWKNRLSEYKWYVTTSFLAHLFC
ncbi:hypothetical protein CCACVL1_05018 [Corchorus capsularis]|uniref:Uncharacterized protein n=1 Tax=Corchorus capsularis TaxID=210143 RepID=A0A1R3JN18_COCAP|nr:hypothetical protein CCACVL1_05018 [Corchorus capsularis]